MSTANSDKESTTEESPSPPVMGVPGQSAFVPYTRPPPPPPPHWVSPGPSGSGAGGFSGAQAVPVGGSGSGEAADPGLRIGGNPAARKRVREGGAGGGGNPPAEGVANQVQCSVCGRVFSTHKALFGHMRSHPERGWRGARPPPAFRAEDEFVDLRPQVGDAAAAPAHDGGGAAEEEEGQNYRLPDLNNSPPADST